MEKTIVEMNELSSDWTTFKHERFKHQPPSSHLALSLENIKCLTLKYRLLRLTLNHFRTKGFYYCSVELSDIVDMLDDDDERGFMNLPISFKIDELLNAVNQIHLDDANVSAGKVSLTSRYMNLDLLYRYLYWKTMTWQTIYLMMKAIGDVGRANRANNANHQILCVHIDAIEEVVLKEILAQLEKVADDCQAKVNAYEDLIQKSMITFQERNQSANLQNANRWLLHQGESYELLGKSENELEQEQQEVTKRLVAVMRKWQTDYNQCVCYLFVAPKEQIVRQNNLVVNAVELDRSALF
jgi:hypothetical protein